MTLATCGRSLPTPFAYFDPESLCLRTSQATFPWASTSSSPTLPRWGSMRNGQLFERQTWGPATSEPDSSSLLLTPTRGDGEGGGRKNPPPRGEGTKDGSGGLREQVRYLPTPISDPASSNGHALNLTKCLPTPTVGDSKSAANRTAGRSNPDSTHHDGVTLTDAVRMLPTPRTSDANGGGFMVTEAPTSERLLPTPTARDWKDGPPCAAVPVNGLLGREVWSLGASSSPPSDDMSEQSADQHPIPPTSEDG